MERPVCEHCGAILSRDEIVQSLDQFNVLLCWDGMDYMERERDAWVTRYQ